MLDEQREIERIVGTNEQWLDKTLSDVLSQWDYLYDTFVAKYDEELKVARKAKRKSADYELLRIKQAMRLSMITNPYVERMAFFEQQVADKANELGVGEENIDYVNDLMHSFFHQPQSEELAKPLRECVIILANELV